MLPTLSLQWMDVATCRMECDAIFFIYDLTDDVDTWHIPDLF